MVPGSVTAETLYITTQKIRLKHSENLKFQHTYSIETHKYFSILLYALRNTQL
jgi:hypothetical protein